MRISLACALFLVCALFGVVPAHASDMVLVHARVYPSPNAPPLENATIAVHDDRVVSVSPGSSAHQAKIPPGATIIDCAGMSVTAGLWNSHIHILPVDFLHADQKTDAQLTASFQQMLTRWGFTSVFDIASILANDNNIRDRIASGKVLGPRMLSTGVRFFPPNGIPSYAKDYVVRNHIILPDDPTTAAAVERVDRQIGEGADGVKIFAGSIEGESVLLMPLDRAKAIATEAHRLKRPVFAHPTSLAGLEIALDSGVDVLAHVTSREDGPWSPALVNRMLAAHMAVVPTLTLFDVELKKAGAPDAVRKDFVDRCVGRLRAYNSAGGRVLFGTDVGYIYQFDTAEEFTLMQQAGMSFTQILASLTTNPAQQFGFAAHSGSIAPGMDADLTVFAADPGADITAFSRVRYTIRAGRVIFSDSQPVSAR